MTHYRAARPAIFTLFAIIVNFCFYSFPAAAASKAFTFIEFNIAFILGLSLPILLLVFISKPTSAIRQYLPILLTLSLLSLLYLLNNQPPERLFLSVIFSGLFLQASCYWSLNYQLDDEKLSTKLLIKNVIFALLLSLFLFLLFSTVLTINIVWLLFSSLQILTVLGYIWLMGNRHAESNTRAKGLLIANVMFAVSVYFFLLGQVSIKLLVGISVFTYIVAIANGCWHLVSTLSIKANQHNAVPKLPSEPVSYDPATNLPNYQYALAFFQQSVKINADAQYAVIVFKPTNFQQVNGVLGHHNSDILLLQLAYCLQKSIEKRTDLLNFSEVEPPVRLARLQGLHFLVVMDMSQNKHSNKIIIEQLCNELMLAVPGPMSFKSFSSFFKLAFGVAFVGKSSHNVSEVIACAEDALLQADTQHKSINFFNQELAIFNQQQLQKMEQLKDAIQQQTLQWHLQPQVKLTNKRIKGFELQVSWQLQDDETLNLSAMMAIAQHSGDAYALSRQMVSQAFKALIELEQLNIQVPVAIKLAGESLLEPDLVDYIEQQSVDYNIDCRLLLVEVQEAILLMASPQAKASIDQLKSLGVQIFIDEFSGSYQALRYIRRLAINGIKIDCGTLDMAVAGTSDKAIINALITLTRKMDLPIIGTNINTLAIEEIFLTMGGEYAQGQQYGAGVSPEALPRWLAAWQQQYPEKT